MIESFIEKVSDWLDDVFSSMSGWVVAVVLVVPAAPTLFGFAFSGLVVLSATEGPVRLNQAFPRDLHVNRMIGSHQWAAMFDGCLHAIGGIEPQEAVRMQALGLTYLSTVEEAVYNKPLSEWRAGPIQTEPDGDIVTADGSPLYARPVLDCNEAVATTGEERAAQFAIVQALQRGEAFYATYSGGKGLIVVAPRARLAAVYYYG